MLLKLVREASADAVLLMLPLAPPVAVAEFDGVEVFFAAIDALNSDVEEALTLARLPTPATSTLLVAESAPVVGLVVEFAVNVPDITPF